MKKLVIIALAVFVVLCMMMGAWSILQVARTFHASQSQGPKITVPSGSTKGTLAVFNLRPSGEADASYYASGFARALADRLYCAPTCVTQQMGTDEITCTLSRLKHDPNKPASDDIAVKAGRFMAVKNIVTGDIHISNGKANITLYVIDVASPAAKRTVKLSGQLSDLPKMQTQAIDAIIPLLGLSPTASQVAELHNPSFTKPETLRLYGESVAAKDIKQCESLRWKMVDSDPKALFPTTRLLEFYCNGPSECRELQANSRLQRLLSEAYERGRGNTHVGIMAGLILCKQCQYARSQKLLARVVENDPSATIAHSALQYIAILRQDSKLAKDEAEKNVKLWPQNEYFHAALAESYAGMANAARQGHYWRDMSKQASLVWSDYSHKCLNEALIASKMNPDDDKAWRQLMDVSLQLGNYRNRDRAYAELRRICPKDPDIYTAYGFGYTPQWCGNPYQVQKVFRDAERALGKDSPEACFVRAEVLSSYADETHNRPEVLREVELGLSKSKKPHYGCLLLQSAALMGSNRFDEAAEAAQKGFDIWGTHPWRFQLARCRALQYQEKRDYAALREAEKLFREYTEEIPYDPYGHCQLGWCLSHLGRREEAKQQFLKALEIDPNNQMAKDKMKYVQ